MKFILRGLGVLILPGIIVVLAILGLVVGDPNRSWTLSSLVSGIPFLGWLTASVLLFVGCLIAVILVVVRLVRLPRSASHARSNAGVQKDEKQKGVEAMTSGELEFNPSTNSDNYVVTPGSKPASEPPAPSSSPSRRVRRRPILTAIIAIVAIVATFAAIVGPIVSGHINYDKANNAQSTVVSNIQATVGTQATTVSSENSTIAKLTDACHQVVGYPFQKGESLNESVPISKGSGHILAILEDTTLADSAGLLKPGRSQAYFVDITASDQSVPGVRDQILMRGNGFLAFVREQDVNTTAKQILLWAGQNSIGINGIKWSGYSTMPRCYQFIGSVDASIAIKITAAPPVSFCNTRSTFRPDHFGVVPVNHPIVHSMHSGNIWYLAGKWHITDANGKIHVVTNGQFTIVSLNPEVKFTDTVAVWGEGFDHFGVMTLAQQEQMVLLAWSSGTNLVQIPAGLQSCLFPRAKKVPLMITAEPK